MGMSSYIKGIRKLDDGTFAAMMKVKLACDGLDIRYPKEVRDFLGVDCCESEEYLRRTLEEVDLPADSISRVPSDCQDIWDVDLSKISPDIKAIRFVNSY